MSVIGFSKADRICLAICVVYFIQCFGKAFRGCLKACLKLIIAHVIILAANCQIIDTLHQMKLPTVFILFCVVVPFLMCFSPHLVTVFIIQIIACIASICRYIQCDTARGRQLKRIHIFTLRFCNSPIIHIAEANLLCFRNGICCNIE